MEFLQNLETENKIETQIINPLDTKPERFAKFISEDEASWEYLLKTSYEIAVKEGLYKGSLAEYTDFVEKNFIPTPLPPQLSGKIEEHILLQDLTVGSSEPTYLELLGNEGVQELREKKDLECLLVGSLGKYSALHFSALMDKINPSSRKNVIDIDSMYLPSRAAIEPAKNLNLLLMNGVRMGFKDGSMDLVCTNNLLHSLRNKFIFDKPSVKNTRNLLAEISRVLKPGGQLLIAEMKYGKHERSAIPNQTMRKEVTELGQSAGFNSIKFLTGSLNYLLYPHAMSAILDENGLATYPKPVMQSKKMYLAANLRK